jgi:general secretion pathway protein J
MTLVEVMVAITILLVMAAMIFETLQNSITFNNLLSQRDETTRGARVALGAIRRAVTLAYLTPNKLGVDRYETVFVGVDDDPDTLIFASLSHQRLYMDSRESDQAEISFFAEDSPSEIGPGLILYLRESGIVDDEPAQDGRILPLAYGVRSFDLKYLDQPSGEWKDEWDTRNADTPYRLPRAIQIGLVMIAPDPEDPENTVDVPFLATVPLHYAEAMINSQTLLAQQLIAQAQIEAGQMPSNTNLFGVDCRNCLSYGGPGAARGAAGGGTTAPRPGPGNLGAFGKPPPGFGSLPRPPGMPNIPGVGGN